MVPKRGADRAPVHDVYARRWRRALGAQSCELAVPIARAGVFGLQAQPLSRVCIDGLYRFYSEYFYESFASRLLLFRPSKRTDELALQYVPFAVSDIF